MEELAKVHVKSPMISGRDYALLALQFLAACGMSAEPTFHRTPASQFLWITCVAYTGMVVSLLYRCRNGQLTATDRLVIVYGFLPIYFFAATLTAMIWDLKYGSQILR